MIHKPSPVSGVEIVSGPRTIACMERRLMSLFNVRQNPPTARSFFKGGLLWAVFPPIRERPMTNWHCAAMLFNPCGHSVRQFSTAPICSPPQALAVLDAKNWRQHGPMVAEAPCGRASNFVTAACTACINLGILLPMTRHRSLTSSAFS